MTEEKHIDAYLGDIQGVFLSKKISNNPDLSWGQFLDNSNNNSQVGLYGTIAGAIALKASNGGISPDAIEAENQLVNYWNNRNKTTNSENLCQNIRLASLLAGLCFKSSNNSTTIKEIADELAARVVAHDGMWGDFSSTGTIASRPSEFSTAMILIFAFTASHFFTGNTSVFSNLNQVLSNAANALQKKYLDDKNRDRPYLMALLIAVVLTIGKCSNSSLKKKLSECARDRKEIFRRHWQYLDYIDHQGNYKRDYFILPFRLLMPIILMRNDIQGTHYLEAKGVLAEIKKTLDSTGSKLFVEPAGRPSSLEQALVILALEASRAGNGFKLSLVGPWITLEFMKPRPQERLFAGFFLAGVYLPVALISGAEWITNTYGTYLWAGGLEFMEAMKTLPAWAPSLLILFSSALRKPNELLTTTLRPGKQK